jgi:glycosyltransferase involved in cell wall biosynthesis
MVARLSLLLPNLAGGGAERVTIRLAEEFLMEGHEVDIVALSAAGQLREFVPAEATLHNLNVRRFRQSLGPLIRYLRQRRPDAIHAAMWPLTIIGILAARLSLTQPRVLVSEHSILSLQYGPSGLALAALRWSTRLLYRFADARISVSPACAADTARLSWLPEDRFEVVNNPVGSPPAGFSTTHQVEALWNGKEPRILTIGNLKPAKDHETLIRAFALLSKRRPATLMIVGEGEERVRLEGIITELGVANRVVMPGFATDAWPYFASADLFVLSSNREGFPTVLIEAMLAGLPVVSTDCVSGPSEILDGGRLGALVPMNDPEALARAMERALDAPFEPSVNAQWAVALSAGSARRYLMLMLNRDSTAQ